MSRSPMDHSSARPYHHGDLRNSLLDAAERLLLSQSPAALSLRSVAREAQVSHAAPYHYFADRAELLKAAGDRCMERFVAAQTRAVAAREDARERLLAMGEAYLDFAIREPHAFSLVYDPELCPPDNPSPERAPLIEANEQLLADVLRDAQRAGFRRGVDPEALGAGLWGAIHGLAVLVTAGHLTPGAARAGLLALLA